MKTFSAAILFAFVAVASAARAPIALHPQNPHYFLWRGQPTVLITSAEHYGAVLNLDFDYAPYLKELQARKLNNTRLWSGAYVEPTGAFNIASNSLAPDAGRFICPWARSSEPGYAKGGNKFDLTKWDENYFKRLRNFVKQAGARGVVVEMNLFCPMYEDSQWKLSPQNAINNVNSVGDVARTNVHTLDKNGGLLAVQEALTRKIVTELNGFDNVYYEICNEPYFAGVTIEWQNRIADVIAETEKSLPNKHLISQNIANGSQKIEKPYPAVSVFNFHYASPPKAVAENYALNKVIGDNETGFKGTNDAHYRMEAWEFILAGGALYNNLDYSFVAGHERGDFVYPKTQPGGGNPEFRRQMTVLVDFINSFDFVRMKPDKAFINSGVPEKMHTYALVEDGKQYAAYFCAPTNTTAQSISLTLLLREGNYRVEWIDVISGKTAKRERVKSAGAVTIISPEFQREIALRIRR
ncbi:MAG TPA: cellulase family glycosylhydrolase [Candidatus Limnocylindria bacterium]|nr:cellulase family glycosylhydrolase [Candidatus Limnocylindria bacterium]